MARKRTMNYRELRADFDEEETPADDEEGDEEEDDDEEDDGEKKSSCRRCGCGRTAKTATMRMPRRKEAQTEGQGGQAQAGSRRQVTHARGVGASSITRIRKSPLTIIRSARADAHAKRLMEDKNLRTRAAGEGSRKSKRKRNRIVVAKHCNRATIHKRSPLSSDRFFTPSCWKELPCLRNRCP